MEGFRILGVKEFSGEGKMGFRSLGVGVGGSGGLRS